MDEYLYLKNIGVMKYQDPQIPCWLDIYFYLKVVSIDESN